METFNITVPAEMTVKVYNAPKGDANRAAIHMTHELAKWHPSAIEELVKKGVARLLNDMLSGVDAKDKPAETRKILDKLNAGEEWHAATNTRPRASGGTTDPAIIRARSKLRRALKEKLGAEEYKKRFTDADAADQIKELDAILAKNAKLVEAARREIAAEGKLADEIVL